jgi:hypothetical protein
MEEEVSYVRIASKMEEKWSILLRVYNNYCLKGEWVDLYRIICVRLLEFAKFPLPLTSSVPKVRDTKKTF